MSAAVVTDEDRAAVAGGTLTVADAVEFSGLSRTELFALMAAGKVVWFAKGAKKTRYITRASLIEVMATLLAEWRAGK